MNFAVNTEVVDEGIAVIDLDPADAPRLGQIHRQRVDRLELEPLAMQIAVEREVVQVEQLAQLLREALGVLQVLHPQGAPRDLVFVGRADAAAGGADRAAAQEPFGDLVQHLVVGRHEVGVGGDPQLGGVRAAGLEPEVTAVDMRAELQAGNRGLFSDALSGALAALDTALARQGTSGYHDASVITGLTCAANDGQGHPVSSTTPLRISAMSSSVLGRWSESNVGISCGMTRITIENEFRC